MITLERINDRIENLNTQITMCQTMIEQSQLVLSRLTDTLPIVRETAYPKDKSETTQTAKDAFKEYLSQITATKKVIRDLENKINTFNKHKSAFSYIKYNREEAKRFENDNYKVLVIDLYDVTVTPNYSIAAIGDPNQNKTVLLGDCPIEDLKFNIENADKVVTFAREDDLEKLRELGITDATINNKKFISIHHIMRGYTNFQREGLQTYADLVGFELTDDNVYNVLRVYCAIVGIITIDEENDLTNSFIEGALTHLKDKPPMLDELTAMIDGMEK